MKRLYSSPRSAALLACTAAALMLGCGSATDPASVDGAYTLTTYDGQPLPVVIRVIASNPLEPGGPGGGNCEDRLTSMTLTLGSDGRFTRASERRLVCDSGQPDDVTQPVDQGNYVVVADSVRLTFDTANETSTTAVAVRGSGTLTIVRQVTHSTFGDMIDLTQLDFRRTQ